MNETETSRSGKYYVAQGSSFKESAMADAKGGKKGGKDVKAPLELQLLVLSAGMSGSELAATLEGLKENYRELRRREERMLREVKEAEEAGEVQSRELELEADSLRRERQSVN